MAQNKNDQGRRFAAIMFSDIAGYTALMGKDEESALKILNSTKKIHQEIIAKYNGTLIKELGDGFLISFDLGSLAVRCAIELQKTCQEQDIPLKIGIHEGETVFSDSDVLGAGVNMAARLESDTEAGGISISDKVYSDIKNLKGIHTKFLGQKRFKNVEGLVGVYNVLTEKSVEKPAASKRKRLIIFSIISLIGVVMIVWQWNAGRIFDTPIEKSIAVIPFQSNEDSQLNSFSIFGIAEEVHSSLSKISDLLVVSTTASDRFQDTILSPSQIAEELQVNYLINGNVIYNNGQTEVMVDLLNVETGKVVWDGRYNFDFTNEFIYKLGSEIAKTISKELNASISSEENRLIEAVPTKNKEAHDFFLRGKEYAKRIGESNTNVSRYFFNRAIELDSNFAAPYTWLGFSFLHAISGDYLAVSNIEDTVKYFADKAMEIDPDLADTHLLLAQYYLIMKNDIVRGISEATIAAELNPNNALAFAFLGRSYTANQDYVNAIIHLNKARKLNMGDLDQSPIILGEMGNCYMAFCDYDRLIEVSEEMINYNPLAGYFHLATSNLMYGDWDMMKTHIDILCAIDSSAACSPLAGIYYACIGDFEQFLIPEGSPGHIPYVEETWLGYVMSHLEKKDKAKAFIDRGKEIWEGIIDNKRWKSPQALYELSAIYAFQGEKEKAFETLHEMEKEFFYGGFLWFMKVDPRMESIREEEEFKQIVEMNERKYADIRMELDRLRNEGKL